MRQTMVLGLFAAAFAGALAACGSSRSNFDGSPAGSSSGGSSGAGNSSGAGGSSGGSASGSGGTAGSAGTNGGSAGAGTGGIAGNGGVNAGGSAGTGASGGAVNAGGSAGTGGGNPMTCEGFPPPGKAICSSSSPCSGGQSCRFFDDPPVCGVPCMASRECESDVECGNAGVCVEYQAGCCPAGTLSSQCRPRCVPATCPAGEQCGTSGHCECTPGGCGVNRVCERESGAPARCVRRECDDASECDCGVCHEGFCTPDPDLGVCEPPVP